MNPHGKRLLDAEATFGAVLRGIRGIYGYHLAVGACSLTHKDSTKHAPTGIGNRLRKRMISHPVIDLKVFDGNQSEPVDETPGGLMNKVVTPVLDALVDTANNLFGSLTGFASVFVLDLIELTSKPCRHPNCCARKRSSWGAGRASL